MLQVKALDVRSRRLLFEASGFIERGAPRMNIGLPWTKNARHEHSPRRGVGRNVFLVDRQRRADRVVEHERPPVNVLTKHHARLPLALGSCATTEILSATRTILYLTICHMIFWSASYDPWYLRIINPCTAPELTATLTTSRNGMPLDRSAKRKAALMRAARV